MIEIETQNTYYLNPENSSFEVRADLKRKAEEVWEEMLFDLYDLDVCYPVKKRLFGRCSRDKGGRILLEKIVNTKEELSKYSQFLYKSGEAERTRAGAKWEEAAPFLQQIGIQIPSNFDLGLIDLNQLKRGEETRHVFEQNLSPPGYYNSNFFLEVDGRYLIFSGQDLFLHSPKYPEPFFLAALDRLEKGLTGEGGLRVYHSKHWNDLADVSRVEYYNVEFGWKGWIFLTVFSSDYDSTVGYHVLTPEEVLKELQVYREGKNKIV